jgi:hypothetical protein
MFKIKNSKKRLKILNRTKNTTKTNNSFIFNFFQIIVALPINLAYNRFISVIETFLQVMFSEKKLIFFQKTVDKDFFIMQNTKTY